MGACGSSLISGADASGKYFDRDSSTEAKSRSDIDQSTYETVGASSIFVTPGTTQGAAGGSGSRGDAGGDAERTLPLARTKVPDSPTKLRLNLWQSMKDTARQGSNSTTPQWEQDVPENLYDENADQGIMWADSPRASRQDIYRSDSRGSTVCSGDVSARLSESQVGKQDAAALSTAQPFSARSGGVSEPAAATFEAETDESSSQGGSNSDDHSLPGHALPASPRPNEEHHDAVSTVRVVAGDSEHSATGNARTKSQSAGNGHALHDQEQPVARASGHVQASAAASTSSSAGSGTATSPPGEEQRKEMDGGIQVISGSSSDDEELDGAVNLVAASESGEAQVATRVPFSPVQPSVEIPQHSQRAREYLAHGSTPETAHDSVRRDGSAGAASGSHAHGDGHTHIALGSRGGPHDMMGGFRVSRRGDQDHWGPHGEMFEAGSAEVAAASKADDDSILIDAGASLVALKSIARQLDTTMKLADLVPVRTIGVGTFGRVRMVRDKRTGKLYALKTLQKARIVRLKQQRNVCYEKAVLASIRHPFLIQLQAAFQDEECMYLVLELVQGGDFVGRQAEVVVFEEASARFYAACVLSGLAHLHERRILYRDLKPDNLLVDTTGYVRLCDFGFAKYVPAGSMTRTLCGTPDFLAPECLLKSGHHEGADYWALGVLIYEMLSGDSPFASDDGDQVETFKRILNCQRTLAFPLEMRSEQRAAVKLLTGLLQKSMPARLGCRRAGVSEILYHEWFSAIDFGKLHRREIKAPWVPKLESEDDTQFFDDFSCEEEEEDEEERLKPGTDMAWCKDF